MRFGLLLCGTMLLLGLPRSAAADDTTTTIADKAIQAMGGAKLTQAHAASWKAKGTATINGEEVQFQAHWTIQGDDRTHIDAKAEANGSTIKVLLILNGKNGWASLAGIQEDMDKDRLDEEHERAYVEWLTTFLPLHDPQLKLSMLAPSKVDERPAVGLKVQRQGRRPVELYFDKDKGLLLKAHSHIKDLLTGTEAEQDIYFQQYKDQGGVPHASKVVFKRDGKPYLDMTVTDFALEKHVPAKLFQKP
ncbi:MAG TPA: hypothetical protein VFA18_21685 [Gemmataceae bacterium]|nr:hypothetical protein [Gemmataceae bacterium]